ncbi:MAG: hypothetical protein KA210_02325 [Bacteroidia bacterium]|nr:hypothetical protein [Bacteroidia bacterium]
MTTYRKLTLAELYPIAYQQDLMKKQAEHFVDKIITNASVASGYENMPLEFPEAIDNSPLIINTKPPQLYIVGYLKNNWKPLLFVGVSVAVLVTIFHNAKQRKEIKKRLNKTSKATNLYLVKQSM